VDPSTLMVTIDYIVGLETYQPIVKELVISIVDERNPTVVVKT